MNRFEEIDVFLKKLANYLNYNPELVPDQRFIYANLINDGIDQTSTRDLFPYWINNFANNPNINVYEHESQRRFLQFNYTPNGRGDSDYIKMYIPQKETHLYESANQIFGFLAANSITHVSKISDTMRRDNIVLRVTNQEDAKKVVDFISRNKYIQEGMLKAIPFSHNEFGIAFACDYMKSYNEFVATMVSQYLINIKNSSNGQINLDNVNFSSFKDYLLEFYKYTFIEDKNYEFIYDNFNSKRDGNLLNAKINLLEINQLLIRSLNTNFSTKDFYEHFENVKFKKNTVDESMSYLDSLLSNTDFVTNTKSQDNLYKIDNAKIYLFSTLTPIYLTMACKYGVEQANYSFSEFIKNGDLNKITRTGNARKIASTININSVINNLLVAYPGLSINESMEVLFTDIINNAYSTAYYAVANTQKKYGNKHAKAAIMRLLNDNNHNSFTNDNNIRACLITMGINSDTFKFAMSPANLNMNNNMQYASDVVDFVESQQVSYTIA